MDGSAMRRRSRDARASFPSARPHSEFMLSFGRSVTSAAADSTVALRNEGTAVAASTSTSTAMAATAAAVRVRVAAAVASGAMGVRGRLSFQMRHGLHLKSRLVGLLGDFYAVANQSMRRFGDKDSS